MEFTSSNRGKLEPTRFQFKILSQLSELSMMSKWVFPRLIAHRGGGILAPENTILAIDTGIKYGIPAVEFDVMLSKDNVPFLMHDEDLCRTVGETAFKNQLLCNVNSADVANIDAGSWFNPPVAGVTIPRFEDVIKHCMTNNVWMNIEIKPSTGYETITGQVVSDLTAKYFPPTDTQTNYPLFSSFSFESLLAAKKHAPHIARGYLIESVRHTPEWKEQMVQVEAVAVHTDHKFLRDEDIAEIKGLGYGLFCYTVNDQETADDLTRRGVDAFCTDRLDIFGKL